jgi:aspartate ammonia-lyase
MAETMTKETRTESDFLGPKEIPAHAYWGVHTARALENFPITGTPISAMPDLIRAFGYVKKSAARANLDLGTLTAEQRR